MANSETIAILSPYGNELSSDVKARYIKKIKAISIDPYIANEWSADEKLLPAIGYEDIVDYLMVRTSAYTAESFKAFKSLGSHNQMTSGWVREVVTFQPKEHIGDPDRIVVISAKVYHSQRLNDQPLQPWVIAKTSGTILSAHCKCAAGLGETCTHVAALLFTVDTMVKLRDSKTVTQVLAYWNQPTFKDVAYVPLRNMDFTSADQRKRKLEECLSGKSSKLVKIPSRKPVPPASPEEIAHFYSQISFANSGVKPALLSLVSGYEHDYVCNSDALLPKLLINISSKDDLITVTEEQAIFAENKTREQASSKLWHHLRIGRITASLLHAVCHTKEEKPSKSLLRQICNPSSMNAPAVIWGKTKEQVAFTRYLDKMVQKHTNFSARKCGLFISTEHPFLGASPDGISACDCCGAGCIEIKCPFSSRMHTVDEAVLQSKNFCLIKCNDQYMLQKNHPYYLQTQCQIFISKTRFCDFVVFTDIDLTVVRIEPDQPAWEAAVQKAKSFFYRCVLPHLINLNKDDTNNGTCDEEVMGKDDTCDAEQTTIADTSIDKEAIYCVCQDVEYGYMVGCDNKQCQYQWFHYECVGLKRKPKGQWFCPDCRNCT